MALSGSTRRVLLIALVGLAALGVAGSAWVWFAPCWLGGCAPLDDLAEYQAEGSELLDVEGNPFGTLATVNRRIVSIDSLPPHVPRAFIAVEDRRFFEHGGIDVRRVLGALLSNVRAGGVAEGGSTISMQLARNLFPEWLPYQERSLRRKLLEVRVARQMERRFSKEKILELYLNHIYLGEGAYGIEAAARTYFGKPAAELTVTEAATLGGLPKAPSQINPVADPDAARERRDLVLTEMADAGFVSTEAAAEARAEPIRLARGEPGDGGLRGSYFIERVRREMEEVIGNRFYTAGLRIHTTLDASVQRAAEEELARQLDAIEAGRYGAFRHDATYPEARGIAKETGETPYLQGVVVVMDAATGDVRALIGGRNFDDSKFDRAVQALRQPGSAFKPFVYLAALRRYGSPVHVVEDAPVRLTLSGSQVWEPRNFTGRYDGPMTLREALTRSKNTATVRLAQEIGIDRVIGQARELGITTEIPDVPATALGAASVRPIEMVTAYAALANGGHRVQPRFIQRVESRRGEVVWEAPQRRERVLDPALAFVLTSMLRDVVDRGTGTAVRAAGFSGPAAGKTGTTNDNADVWFVGYTPDLVGGVWIGFDEPRSIVRAASGGTLAAPVWGRLMRRVYAGRRAPLEWSPPPGVVTAVVERATGQVVDASCPASGPTYTEYFVHDTPPTRTCAPDRAYAGVPPDTLWGDEERDTLGVGEDGRSLSPGIDWPELEEMRRRMRGDPANPASGAPTGAPATPPASGTAEEGGTPPAQPPQQSSGQRPPTQDPTPQPPAREPTEAQPRDTTAPPRVIGTPVRRDSVRPEPGAEAGEEADSSAVPPSEPGSIAGRPAASPRAPDPRDGTYAANLRILWEHRLSPLRLAHGERRTVRTPS